MKCLPHLIFIVFSLFFYGVVVVDAQRFQPHRLNKDRNSIFGRKDHKFSCIRSMKYWNGLACEDFTEKTCTSNDFYWDSTANKCFYTEESACHMKNKHWTGEACVDHTKDTCLEENMVWNTKENTCDYKQDKIQYIDLNEH